MSTGSKRPRRLSALVWLLVYVALSGSAAAAPMAAGDGHVLALRADGSLWAWGQNDKGQLGIGNSSDRPTPTLIEQLGDVRAVAAGASHSIAVRRDGTVWTWGEAGQGRLGVQTNIDRFYPTRVALAGITEVAAGHGHSLALQEDGSLWAWGGNGFGQLGDGSDLPRRAPVPVRHKEPMQAVAAGGFHGIALSAAGEVWVWGRNSAGQLGTGDRDNRRQPVKLRGLSEVVAIAAGGAHSLALQADGSVWAWGYNYFGQLGDGSTRDRDTPAPVREPSDVVAIAAGGTHSLALTRDGRLWAWGDNGQGQLGDGRGEHYSPWPLAAAEPADIEYIAAGLGYSLARAGDGSLWAFGDNGRGQLGLRGSGGENRPARLPGFVATSTDPLSVHAEPQRSLVGQSIQFFASPQLRGPLHGFSWDFGDGHRSDMQNPRHRYTEPGDYRVRLTLATADEPIVRELAITVAPVEPPRAAITVTAIDGKTVALQSTSSAGSGKISTQRWRFGNGLEAYGATAGFSFSDCGEHPVELRVTNSHGASDATVRRIEIPCRPPRLALTVEREGLLAGDELRFFARAESDGDRSVRYRWDFGDGQSSELQNPRHVYRQAGRYRVLASVTDSDGLQAHSELELSVEAPRPPVAGIVVGSIRGKEVSLRAATQAGSGEIVAYRWRLGERKTATRPQADFTLRGCEPETVELTVRNSYGLSDSARTRIDPACTPPTLEIGVDRSTITATQSVRFEAHATDSDGAIVAYHWELGDGTISNARNPRQRYDTPGDYLVRATVTDDDGLQASRELTLRVLAIEPPQPRFVYSYLEQRRLAFESAVRPGSGELTGYAWRFGDYAGSEEAHPQFEFPSCGEHAVSLRVTNSFGASDELTQQVLVPCEPDEPDEEP